MAVEHVKATEPVERLARKSREWNRVFPLGAGLTLTVCIVSHKTLHPFIGPKYDLHQAARSWVETHLIDEQGALVAPEPVFFEPTKESKWSRIAATGCDSFIDDLPEILLAQAFPQGVSRLLFDPESHHADEAALLG